MEASREIDVIALDAEHRRALEDLIGTELRQNQRLLITIREVDVTPSGTPPGPAQSIGDWINVYSGLPAEVIDAIDRDLKTRANLTRDLP